MLESKSSHHELIKTLYKKMLLIRKVEEYITHVYHTDIIKSPVHLSIGQEAIAVGVCQALNNDDIISNTFRSHATYIAKDGSLNRMFAELYGKKNGCANGKAGSMHLIDMQNGVLGCSAIVASNIPVAVGYAFALKQEAKKTKRQRVVVCMFGDGATEEGCFSESLNFAALHKLPIIFVCENNGLAIHAPLNKRWAWKDLCARVAVYNIHTAAIKDGDVFNIYKTMQNIITQIRENFCGPYFLECTTYRYLEHVGVCDDHHEKYRDINELKKWRVQDQIIKLANLLNENDKKIIVTEIDNQIQAAINFAQECKFPDHEDLYCNVFA